MKKTFAIITLLSFFLAITKIASAHCEVPCGIYQDELRIELIKEHIQTIEKAMNQIIEIQKSDNINYNQLVRWINTKEEHAKKIQEIAEQYFLTQRVKFADPSDKEKYVKYTTQLALLHQIIVYSMKTKQTTDLKFIKELNTSVTKFEKSYFGEHHHDHKGDHK